MKLIGEKIYLTYEESIKILPEKEKIHTLINASFALIGADWAMEEIMDKLKKSDVIEVCGEVARGMGHGICAYNKKATRRDEILFIETDNEKLNELLREVEG